MKKRLTLLICLLLVALLAFSSSCANTDLSKIVPEVEMHKNLATLESLTKDDVISHCDNFGLMIIETPTYDGDSNLVSTKYRLYNSRTDVFIEGAVSDVLVDGEPADDALSCSIPAGIHHLTDGMYAVATLIGSRESVEETFEFKVKVELFGKNGKAGEAEFDETVLSNDPYDDEEEIFTDWSGVRYYVNVKGNLVKENNVFERILTYENAEYSEYAVENYHILWGEGYIEVYDLDGKYLRSVDMYYSLGLTENMYDDPVIWTVGDYIFVQYLEILSKDAKNYDFEEFDYDDYEMRKYDVITKRYDVKEDKVKDFDFDLIVHYGYSFAYDCAFLYYSEILDKQVGSYELVQCYDKDLKVALDIQKLVPGAYDVETSLDYLFVWSASGLSVIEGKEVVNVFDYNVDVDGNSIVVETSPTSLSIYNVKGQLKKSYTEVEDYNVEWGFVEKSITLWLKDSIVSYNLTTHEETVLASFDNQTTFAVLENHYVMTVNVGEDGEMGNEDDFADIRFLVGGIADVRLQYDDEIYVSVVGGYYEYGMDSMYSGEVIRVEIYDAETQTTTVTYYRHEMVMAIEAEGK